MGQSLGKVKIQRGIFQGDSLSPLLFIICLVPLSLILRTVKAGFEFRKSGPSINHLLCMDDVKLFGKTEKQLESLMNTVRIFSDDIRMEFGIKKCGVLVMKKGKHVRSEGIEIPSGEKIKEIDLANGYKYLGILEADGIKDKCMKENFRSEILKSKSNSKNTISAINSRAVSIIRYSAGIVTWSVNELQDLDRKTRKLLTMYSMFHKKGDVDRLYIKRTEGGRGLISEEDCVFIERNCLYEYIRNSQEPMLMEIQREGVVDIGAEKNSIKDKRKNNLKEKKLHNAFFSSTEFRDVRSWDWLKRGDLKKATEGTLMAAQERAIRTRSIKHHIDREDISPLCRICGEREETVAHLISECKNLAQKQYKQWRHDKITQVIHWQLCKDYNLEHAEKWYGHSPQVTIENDMVEILWDMKIQTDKVLEHSRPDILVLEKDTRICKIIDVACPFDTRIIEKEREKVDHYQDLKWELKKIWQCSDAQVVPIIIEALGTVSKSFQKWLERISLDMYLGTNQHYNPNS